MKQWLFHYTCKGDFNFNHLSPESLDPTSSSQRNVIHAPPPPLPPTAPHGRKISRSRNAAAERNERTINAVGRFWHPTLRWSPEISHGKCVKSNDNQMMRVKCMPYSADGRLTDMEESLEFIAFWDWYLNEPTGCEVSDSDDLDDLAKKEWWHRQLLESGWWTRVSNCTSHLPKSFWPGGWKQATQ